MSGTDKMSVTICCPGIPPSANVLKRKFRNPHAYARLRDGWQRTLWALISGANRRWLEVEAQLGKRMRVEASLLHGRAYDSDNAAAAMKPILDSLVRLKFLADDDPAHLELVVTQQKIRANETWIHIREAE